MWSLVPGTGQRLDVGMEMAGFYYFKKLRFSVCKEWSLMHCWCGKGISRGTTPHCLLFRVNSKNSVIQVLMLTREDKESSITEIL